MEKAIKELLQLMIMPEEEREGDRQKVQMVNIYGENTSERSRKSETKTSLKLSSCRRRGMLHICQLIDRERERE